MSRIAIEALPQRLSHVLLSLIGPMIALTLIAATLIATPNLSAQDAVAEPPTENKPATEKATEETSQSPEKKVEEKAEETPDEEKTADSESVEKGEDDLAKATALKLKATTLSDLDSVIVLCESAIKKGLSKESAETANDLLQGVLFEYATQVSSPIFSRGRPDPKWQFLREQANRKLERLVELGNEWSETYILMAKLNVLPNGDRRKAIEAASKAVEFAGEDVNQLSEALFIRGSLTENEQSRIADFNQAVKINPRNIRALRERAKYYLRKQDHEKAIDDFERMVELTDGDPKAYQQLIESMLIGNRIDEALEVSDEALGRNEKQAPLHSLRARIFRIQEAELTLNTKEDLTEEEETEIAAEAKELQDLALKSLNRAIELAPRDVASLMMRTELHLQNDDLEAARKDVDRMLVIAPNLVKGIFLRSIIAGYEGDFPAAIRDLEILVQADPGEPMYRLQLASMYSADDRPQKAIEIFEEILKDDSESLGAIRGLADAYLGKGDHEKALKMYDRSLKLEPEDDHVLNNLAWLLATSTKDELRDGKRAIELALKACELTNYEEAHILSTLAAGYAETGDFENALKWSEKAVEKGDDKVIEDLKKELESYKRKEAWREKQEPKKEEEKGPTTGGGDFEF